MLLETSAAMHAQLSPSFFFLFFFFSLSVQSCKVYIAFVFPNATYRWTVHSMLCYSIRHTSPFLYGSSRPMHLIHEAVNLNLPQVG
ncbi:hypothetical protein F4811DRAFT_401423 [Daldinia bambusicola]|nr:hypothetical protein F4811DRAFT_401423 [Daldinia bambusicola]